MPESISSRSSKNVVWIAIAVVIAAGFFSLHYLLRDKVTVHTAQASYQDLLSTISTNGKVEPVADFSAHSSGGTVDKVFVREGQQVHQGDLLLTMNADDARARLSQANEQVQSAKLALQSLQAGGSAEEQINLTTEAATAQLQVQQAQRDLAATQKLQQSGAASAGEIASAQQRLQTAQNSLASTQQRKSSRFTALDRAHAESVLSLAQANYAAAAANMKNVEIRSPLAGTVYSLSVKPYDYVAAGDGMVAVADLSHLRVRAYFDEPEIGKLAVGQSVKIVWEAKPNFTWHGHITQVPNTVITYGTRTVGEILISVEDSDGQLLPNTNVNTTVTTLARNHVLAVPREALHIEGASNYIYVVNDHTLIKRAIQIGGVNLTQVEIVSGLNQGDTIALSMNGTQPLSNGLHVDTIQ